MNKDKIKAIDLNNFRGATKPLQIEFDPKKSMVMIFGENGTGKSTLIDAIDFIFNKKAGSLTEKSSTNVKNHLPALGSKPKDIEISITSSQNQEWHGKLNGETPEITGNDDSLSVAVLRRDKILKLINAEPKKRYDTLKNFIELPTIRSSENSLRDLIKSIKTDLDHSVSTKTDKENNLRESWEKEGKSGESFLSWAEEISKKENKELEEKIKKYDEIIFNINQSIDCYKKYKELNQEFSDSEKKLNETKKTLQEISSQNQPEEIIDILQKTQSFLQKEKTAKECPACEQAIVPEDLQKRITARLKNMEALVEANTQNQKAENTHNFNTKQFVKKKEELEKVTTNMIDFFKKEKNLSKLNNVIDSFNKNNFLVNSLINSEKADLFFKDIDSVLSELKSDSENDTKTRNQLNLIKTSLSSLHKTAQKIQKLSNKKEYLAKILKIIENERKTYVEGLLSKISNDVQKLYSKLHPHEGLDNIRLHLKPKAQGSLEIKSSFQNKNDVPPQAYFSDSHLDTLGICIFIAMAKFFKDNIIVLDDVVTSLDQQHLGRFIEILSNENQYFNQIIVTTHYRPWREKYKYYRQANANINLIELSAFWSLDQGIKSGQTHLPIEELEALTKEIPFNRQNAGSKTGIFLESMLDHIALIYGLRVPRRPEPKYTLGELKNSFLNNFMKTLKIKNNDSNIKSLSTIMNDLFQTMEPVRNTVGAHWNESGMDISDKEVRAVLENTIKFGKMLICSKCGGLPQKKKTDCWQCSCGKTSLYPLSK